MTRFVIPRGSAQCSDREDSRHARRARAADQGRTKPGSTTVAEFEKIVKDQVATFDKIVKTAGVKVE